jgi:REP element-mobilizing transposase RayT
MDVPLGEHRMPRWRRLDLAHIPQHIVQRGNDRQPCFFTEEDYVRYVNDLREISHREGCAVHVYMLMTNHVQPRDGVLDASDPKAFVQAAQTRYWAREAKIRQLA